MYKQHLHYPFFVFLLVLLSVQSCKKDTPVAKATDEYANKVAVVWFEKLRELTKVCPGFTPPVASRAFGHAGVALYESVVHGAPGYRSLSGQLTGLGELPHPEAGKTYHWPSCANAAMVYMARNLYANMPSDQQSAVTDLESQLLTEFSAEADAETISRSAAYGKAVAEAVFEWSKGDSGHEGYAKNFPASYVPPTGDGMWAPTAPAFQKALQPYWGSNREFVPGVINYSQPVPPKPFSTDPVSPFYQQALEVFVTVNNLTPEQEKIAQFWSDDPGQPGTPPGHSISIATQVLQNENTDLAKAAETYCKVGIAVADAFISCWKCKYEHNLLRPITYIRDVMDPNWNTVLNTPPFPEYTSGHSVQSGATAQVLSDLFGYNYAFTDKTHEKRGDIDGSPRFYHSFFDAANEAALSRLYGGIHYRDAIEIGLEQGKKVGESVSRLGFHE